VSVRKQGQDGIHVVGEDHPNNILLNRMFHRLSEAFEEGFADLDDKPIHKRKTERLLQRNITPSLSGFALFDKEIKEGWENVSPNQFPYPSAPMDPKTEAGKELATKLGGVDSVKSHYDAMVRMAKDDTQLNIKRKDEVKKVYGIEVPNPSAASIPGPTQVYAVGNAYVYTMDQAPQICAKYGGKVATTAQLEDAQKHGADWCYSGWVAEGGGKWPITVSPIGGCGGRQGIIHWTPYYPEYGWDGHRAGVNCYGPKPRPDQKTEDFIWPFNGTMWDQPTEQTYVTIPSGYLETSGPQPACFYGLSPDQAKKNCDRLGSQCVGFSYSKDGAGHGCYKGNHDAGLNGNSAYMGYVKTPISNVDRKVIVDELSWLDFFQRVDSNFKMVISGSGRDRQIQLNSASVYSSNTVLWASSPIQNYDGFIVEFEIFISNASADGVSFNVGSTYKTLFGEGPNPPAVSISFHLYWPHRVPGIYLLDSGTGWPGKYLGFFRANLGTSSWVPVRIIYSRRGPVTWSIYYNNQNIINHYDPNNNDWVVNRSGNFCGFASRTGGATHDSYIRRFRLSVDTMTDSM